jgi:hypothetical protein
MKKILTACAVTATRIQGFLEGSNRFIAAASIICFAVGLALSHRIEPGVRVQKAMLAEETPAFAFLPAGPGPHPVALLAHGSPASKETVFRYGEALAAAGFICYGVDLPGYGASPRTYTFMDTVHTLEAVAHEVGPVDVFLGDSMGGFWGGEAVREGVIRPGLFIALGSMPILGDHAPPLLLLAGRFEEAFPPAILKTRTDARVVISPWSDHVLELWDPLLVNTAVQAACAAVHKTPPPSPTAWRWRLLGAVLAILAAGKLASCLTDLFPRWARFRGLFIAVFVVVAFMLTIGGRWLDATPHLRVLPKQGIAMAATFLLARIAGRLRIPRWSFAALGVLVMMIAFCWLNASGSSGATLFALFTVISLTPALIGGTLIGSVAARCGSRLQGDIAMAIIVGCAAFQWIEFPRMAPEVLKPHDIIKLDAKLLDACIGEYEIAPDNVFRTGTKVTIRRDGDHLIWQAFGKYELQRDLDLYPESETNFFRKNQGGLIFKYGGAQVTFVKNDKGEVTAIIRQMAGRPDSEGRKLKNE